MKKWQCSVCGYVHEGNEPPDTCPVCGADKSMFDEVIEQAPSQPEPPPQPEKKTEVRAHQSDSARIFEMITGLLTKHHAHPISVHIPNGVVPLSVLFILLSIMFGSDGLEETARYNIMFVFLSMPLVLFSGYTDWKNRYGGALTNVFLIKIVCGAVVTLSSVILTIWWIADPLVLEDASSHGGVFVAVSLLMLAAAGVAGFFGGKLVFKD